MKTNKQQGFTLIELIIVIVILGILAVTASPKFLDLTTDARKSSVSGLVGAIKGAANIVYSKSAIEGETSVAASDSPAAGGTDTDYGYPEASATGIQDALGLDTTNDWDIAFSTTPEPLTATITPKGYTPATGTKCEVVYTEATSATVAYTVTSDLGGC